MFGLVLFIIMGSQKQHDKMQKNLVGILKAHGYKYIFENIEYHVDGKDGELDVLASRDGHIYHMYEIKSGKGRINTARNQFKRALDVIEHLPTPYQISELKGVYVGRNKIKRLYT